MLPVTVIIPVYNRATVVRDAVESLLLQRAVDEIIVIDDASTDNLYRFFKPYHKRLTYIRLDKNSGVSSSRNCGVSLAKNQFIAFLDSDDIFLPNKIKTQYQFMADNGYRISHTDELWLRDDKWINQGVGNQRFGGDIFCDILDRCRVSVSTMMVDKDIFSDIGLFDEGLRVCEDYEFILRASTFYNIGYLRENLTIKRAFLDDQLSKNIRFIESIRRDILIKFYDNYYDKLSPVRRVAVEEELERKNKIVKVFEPRGES